MEEKEDDNGLETARVLQEIGEFIQSRESYYKKDRTDFRRSKNLAAGNGWFERLSTAWGEARSNLTINPLKKIVDSTCNTFLRNPFQFDGLGDTLNESLNKALFTCLRDACNDGLGYLYIYHTEKRELKFKTLANTHVMYSKDKALVIDKKSVGRNESRSKKSAWNNTDVLALANDEIPVVTFFKKTEAGVTVYKIEGDDVVSTMELPKLPCLPIIRIKGRVVDLKNEDHYRGYYYEFQDTVAAMNAYMSRAAEMAIAKTPVIMAEESMPLNAQYQEAWQSNEPRNLYLYRAFEVVEGINPISLPPPIPSPYTQDLDTLNKQITLLSSFIDGLSGMNLNSEAAPNETATAVLDRRESRHDAQSELLYYLNNSAHKIARCIEAYFLVLGFSPVAIKVINRLDQSFRNRNALDLYLTLTQAQAPQAVAMKWLELMGAPDEILETLRQPQGEDPIKDQLAQKLNEATAMLQQERQKNELIMMQNAQSMDIEMKKLIQDAEKFKLEHEAKMLELQIEKQRLDLEAQKVGLNASLKQQEIITKAGA